MGHVGQELRRVLAGDFELATLFGNSRKSRAFWMANADCVAKVRSSSIVSAEKSAGRLRDTTRHPIDWSSRTIGTAKTGQGRPLDVMRHAIALNGSFFTTQRMVLQYVTKAYFR
jgi:hypothetical protein